MINPMKMEASRRNFLMSAPAAAAAGLALTNTMMCTKAGAQTAPATATRIEPFQIFTAAKLADDVKKLTAAPGNIGLFTNKGSLSMVTVETAKSAKEFEWHESRDHVFVILDGETEYELGGTAKNGRKIREGEWLAPEAEGAEKLTLRKGDVLSIPRNVLHRRSTKGSVTFILITAMS